jgi:hypothetical protein
MYKSLAKNMTCQAIFNVSSHIFLVVAAPTMQKLTSQIARWRQQYSIVTSLTLVTKTFCHCSTFSKGEQFIMCLSALIFMACAIYLRLDQQVNPPKLEVTPCESELAENGGVMCAMALAALIIFSNAFFVVVICLKMRERSRVATPLKVPAVGEAVCSYQVFGYQVIVCKHQFQQKPTMMDKSVQTAAKKGPIQERRKDGGDNDKKNKLEMKPRRNKKDPRTRKPEADVNVNLTGVSYGAPKSSLNAEKTANGYIFVYRETVKSLELEI